MEKRKIFDLKNNRFIYSLRFCIDPDHHAEDNFLKLITFCEKAEIDDVMFFIAPEELNNGHLKLNEAKQWIEMIAYFKKRLAQIGITTSINPWITLLHTDRGRVLKTGQNFTTMVDPYGYQCTTVACPLCSEWKKYILELYTLYASIKPAVIWVEDDFRLHNHEPLEWGGCFCDLHLEQFSVRAGRKLTRVKFVENLLKPGEPHAFRKIWLDTLRESMVELAELIGEAVHRVSPKTLVGLMSSHPQVHSAEGRDWKGILNGLAGGTPLINRPHLPSYFEITPIFYSFGFNSVSRLNAEFVPESTLLLPELENFPYTNFSKSSSFMSFQIETTLALGANGITLNIFDLMGNGINSELQYDLCLRNIKNYLTTIKQLKLNSVKQKGIIVLCSEKSTYTLQTKKGVKMNELYPQETFWAEILSLFGIANTYSSKILPENKIIAVSGQYFRNLTDNEIFKLFKDNFILLNGDSAATLFEMGLGHLAGIKNAQWKVVNSGVQSFEQVSDGKKYCGFLEARMTSQIYAGDYLMIDYFEEPEIRTVMKNPASKIIGIGMAVVDDRVFILPYGNFGDHYISLLNNIRMEIIKDIIVNLNKFNIPIFTVLMPNVSVQEYQQGNNIILFMSNFSNDDYENIKIYIPQDKQKISKIKEINKYLIEPESVEYEVNDNIVMINSRIPRIETRIFIIENNKS